LSGIPQALQRPSRRSPSALRNVSGSTIHFAVTTGSVGAARSRTATVPALTSTWDSIGAPTSAEGREIVMTTARGAAGQSVSR